MRKLSKNATSLSNPTNACVVIKTHNTKILLDPWFTDGIYDGTWHNFPRLTDSQKNDILKDVDAVLISHLHKDHFDIGTLKKLPSKTRIIIPKVFGWQVMKIQLEVNGFTEIKLIEEADNVTIGNLLVRLIPPLNSSGLEAHEDFSENQLCIDAGYRLDNLETKLSLIFLADNSLYNESAISKYHHLLSSPDLIAFAYSGFASDYPFNYSFSVDEMLKICNEGENRRFTLQSNNLKVIRPKYILPYSSEFVPVGSHSNTWMNCYPKVWTSDKEFVARKYAEELNCNAGTLYPDEELIFKARIPQPIIKTFDRNAIIEMMLDYRHECEDTANSVNSFEADIISESIISQAAKNYFEKQVSVGLHPRFDLRFYLNNKFLFGIKNDRNLLQFSEFESDNVLDITSDASTLRKLLTGTLHWNDACLSLKLKWERSPNLFDSDSYNNLHYLRVPPAKPTQPQLQ